MDNTNWIEWLGYFSSVMVAISLLMTSIVKLRIFNLIGSGCFIVYGLLIKAIPVAAINTIAVIINCYQLYKLFVERRVK